MFVLIGYFSENEHSIFLPQENDSPQTPTAQPITKEPIDDIVLQEFSNEFDSNLNIYINSV